ncbi:MAG: DJ-1/PfpI family protein [Clostridia bacterium]|nr:DJ-1/PfpI family protein [Clostridia bacterium]
MIYLFLAPGFEETEAICPLDLMKRGGLDVKTVAVGDTLTVTSTRGITVTADLLLKDLPEDAPEGVILPGGMPGADNLNIPQVHKHLHACHQKGGLVAAICAAPYVLGEQGLLQGKRAVCYPGFEDRLLGATVENAPTVKDGTLLTAVGMGASVAFGLQIVAHFKGEQEAERIAKAIFAPI